MTQQEANQIEELVRSTVEGVGNVVANRHSEVVLTCITAFLAIARQPSIDVPKLIGDMENLMAGLSDEFQGKSSFGPALIDMLRLQLERENT